MSAYGVSIEEATRSIKAFVEILGKGRRKDKRVIQNLRVDPKLRDLKRECKEEVRDCEPI